MIEKVGSPQQLTYLIDNEVIIILEALLPEVIGPGLKCAALPRFPSEFMIFDTTHEINE